MTEMILWLWGGWRGPVASEKQPSLPKESEPDSVPPVDLRVVGETHRPVRGPLPVEPKEPR
jgi:hypothetical protein